MNSSDRNSCRSCALRVARACVAVVLLLTSGLAQETPRPIRWSDDLLSQPQSWYLSAEARKAADSVMRYQSAEGGWPKNTDLLNPPSAKGTEILPTIDNGATTTPMRFLALMESATGESKYLHSFQKGLTYLLDAQYPNGGWPQFFPLREGYYSHITFNDNAMVNVLTLLRDVERGDHPYGSVSEDYRRKAAAAVERGINVILRSQVKQEGKLTAWCAQHDENTLKPAWARAYEPPSLSGGESVGIVRFLMTLENPTPDIVASIEGAVSWLRSVAMSGVRVDRIARPDGRTERVLVKHPNAPPLWARFYELDTNRPLYLDRDSIFRYDFSEIGYERRSGYSYHGDWATSLLKEDYPRWRSRLTGADGGKSQ